MSYDLYVGPSALAKHDPTHVGQIEMDELPTFGRLRKRTQSFLVARLSNLFEDQTFSVSDLRQARTHLHELLPRELGADVRALVHKLLACVSYAIEADQPLHGLAD